MREVNTEIITEAIAGMCIDACCNIHSEILETYQKAYEKEKSPAGREVLLQIIENVGIASDESIPACQDTGMVVVFADIGREVVLKGLNILDAINEGIRKGYSKGYLRKSIVNHPLDRDNTGDNTPGVVYLNICEGDRVRLRLMPKGFGSENMSALAMLKPSDGREGVVAFILKTIEDAGPNACPPLFVGVGLGGTAEKAMLIAKKSLLRKPGERSSIATDRSIEEEIIKKANELGIGPAGLGGTVTVLDVFVNSYPTHIAGLPVAVNICCHSLRHGEAVI